MSVLALFRFVEARSVKDLTKMALQALKETKNSAARYRLGPPSSPSRRAGSSSAVVNNPQPFKSRILAALDAEMENMLPEANAVVHGSESSAMPAQTEQTHKVVMTVAVPKPNRNRSLTNTCVYDLHEILSPSSKPAI